MTASELMVADVRRTLYDHDAKTGLVQLGGFTCTDMTGAIRYFTAIDPDVRRIITINEYGPDVAYVRRDQEWFAVDLWRRRCL